MLMLAEFGTLSLKEVLAPAMQMADGYPVEEEFVRKIGRILPATPKLTPKATPDSDRELAAEAAHLGGAYEIFDAAQSIHCDPPNELTLS